MQQEKELNQQLQVRFDAKDDQVSDLRDRLFREKGVVAQV